MEGLETCRDPSPNTDPVRTIIDTEAEHDGALMHGND